MSQLNLLLLTLTLLAAGVTVDACVDLDPQCPEYSVREGREVYCQRPWPQANCQLYCGVCQSDSTRVTLAATPAPTVTTADPCVDLDPQCPEYSVTEGRDVYCQRRWPQANCRLYCGVCQAASTTSPITTMTTSMPVTLNELVEYVQKFKASSERMQRYNAEKNSEQLGRIERLEFKVRELEQKTRELEKKNGGQSPQVPNFWSRLFGR